MSLFSNDTKNRIFSQCALYFIIKRSGKSLSQDFATKSTINNVKLLSNCKSKRQHVKGIVAVLWFLVVDREQLANEEQPQKQRCCCESSQRCALARFSLHSAALVRGGLFVFCVHMCLFVCERIILLFPQVLSHLSENSLET